MKDNIKKVALHNLGCKVNAYETEVMEQILKNAGYEIVDFAPGADIYIINTCTVTNIADRKSRQMLHKAKKMNPDAIVVAAGCYTETDKDKVMQDNAIDILVGNNRKRDILAVLEEYYEENKKIDATIDINHTSEYEEMTLEQMNEHTRAYIKIQDGCNQFCSYCIIPYARGRVRSRKISDIKNEVEKLAHSGFREIVITGIHLSSYGIDFSDADEKKGLIDAIETVASVEGIERVRLGSLEPRIITTEFMERLIQIKEFCPHFHLSLQSGCDTVLKRMNRKYTADEFYAGCELIRQYYPDAALTTDIIVGFPGETEEEYKITRGFAEKVAFAELHVFKYSMRHGTVAAKMENQVNDTVKAERSADLIKCGNELKHKYMEKFIGENAEVLFEEEEIIDGTAFYTGHTREYIKVAARSERDLTNVLTDAKITEIYNDEILLAEI